MRDQTHENRDGVLHRAHEPTKTTHTPPNPPATKDFTFSAAADTAEAGAFVVILLAVTCSDESPLCSEIQFLRGTISEKGKATHHRSLAVRSLNEKAKRRGLEGAGGRRGESHHKLKVSQAKSNVLIRHAHLSLPFTSQVI